MGIGPKGNSCNGGVIVADALSVQSQSPSFARAQLLAGLPPLLRLAGSRTSGGEPRSVRHQAVAQRSKSNLCTHFFKKPQDLWPNIHPRLRYKFRDATI